MENGNNSINNFSFLNDESIQEYFADINIMLLSGKHIDLKYYKAFNLLETYELEWQFFYNSLYKLNLIPGNFDGHRCYYLDFIISKGEMSENKRNQELTGIHTIIGLILWDIYYQKYFDEQKIIVWSDIKHIVMESDHQDIYKRIFFKSIRNSYDEKEWGSLENRFKSAIAKFDKLGWVEKQSSNNEDLIFEIRPSINRLGEIYKEELKDLESFANKLEKHF